MIDTLLCYFYFSKGIGNYNEALLLSPNLSETFLNLALSSYVSLVFPQKANI